MVSYKLKDQFIRLNKENRLYHLDFPIIGLTGGIATGKTTVSNFFKGEGFNYINADDLVRSIYNTDKAKEFINKNFPESIKDNSIDFKILRNIFFNNNDSKKLIENFVYADLEKAFLKEAKGLKNLVIYDVPLLFEKSLNKKVDLVITVYCPEEIQLKRLMERDKIEESLAQKIIKSQIPIEKKRELSDFVIRNDETLEKTALDFDKIKNQIFIS